MHNFITPFRFLVGLLAIVCLSPVMGAVHYGDITIQLVTTGSGDSTFGYVDYQVTISNTGDVDRVVKVIMPEAAHGYGNYVRQMTRQVTVPAGTASTVSLFQPPLQMAGSGIAVAIDGRLAPERIPMPGVTHCQSWYGNERGCCVLVSQQVGYDDVSQGSQSVFEKNTRSYGSTEDGLSLALSELPISSWSRNWLSYSRYSGILMTGREWTQAPTEVKRGILEYVCCGGSLVIAGPVELEESVKSLAKIQLQEEIFQTHYPGFGVLHTTTNNTDISLWDKSDWQVLKKTWMNSSKSLQNTKSVKAANDWFPVIEDLTIPVRGLLLIVLIFAILIGPANLFILGRKKRQIWLLWTVPLLSLLASVIVFGYATLAEGWKGYSRILSLTILDEQQKQASTVGVTAFYCPLTPREGLHFDYETECTAQVERDTHNGRGRTVDWTEGQHLKSGWVSARVPVHFKVRKSQMRREKIIFSGRPDGPLEALNGFGVPVQSLYYVDSEGNMYSAENLQPGAKVQMTLLSEKLSFGTDHLLARREVFSADWVYGAGSIIKEPASYLMPNCYIAILNESLFVEKALQKPTSETVQAVVYGISQGVADAG